MFVGVGASRVRDLFEQARTRAPSIIFIDEIDAVGSRRGVNGFGGHDEREQTLNQLLAEMDGFDQSSGVVVLAATNRPETLDSALLRPGRFDRQVTVPLPNQAERAAILAVHIDGKQLAPDVDLGILARGTPGFSGADLANLVNEAAINAVRDDRTVLTAADLAAARDRVLLGRRDSSNALLPEERHSVAVHESGHALVAALCEHADPVAKVTILPAGMALGATEQLPEAERHLYRENYLTDLLAVRLGGRAAELVVFGEASTGAANDLAGATALAAKMVTEFGLSPALGPIGYSRAIAAGLQDDRAELLTRDHPARPRGRRPGDHPAAPASARARQADSATPGTRDGQRRGRPRRAARRAQLCRAEGGVTGALLRPCDRPLSSASSVSCATRMDSAYPGSCSRFHISSSGTSSTWLTTHQMLPNGSLIRPPRWPKALSDSSVTTSPPAAVARENASSASATNTRKRLGMTGQSACRSKASTTVLPTRISPCPIKPSSVFTRASSSPPNALVTKSRNAPVSSVTTHGATVL